MAWNCYAGSPHVNRPDLGDANACLFFQPDSTCRENYAKVTFEGRETCRCAELRSDKASWYTLEKQQGVKIPMCRVAPCVFFEGVAQMDGIRTEGLS